MQPNARVARLKHVIADRLHRQHHPVALELLLRLVAVALAAAAILGLLPLIAEVAA